MLFYKHNQLLDGRFVIKNDAQITLTPYAGLSSHTRRGSIDARGRTSTAHRHEKRVD